MSARVHPVYLLAGHEFLVDEALARVRVEVGTDPLSEVSFEAKSPIHEMLDALDTPSLLGGRRLVLVRDAQDLLKDHVERLTRYLESPSEHAALVLLASGRTKLDAAVRRIGALVSLDAPKGRRLVAWLRERATGKGLKIDDRGAWALIDAVGTELRDLDGALDQLHTTHGPGARITAAQVTSAFPRKADERIFAFTDAVGDRRLAPAMTALTRLVQQGEEPLVVFAALTGQVRRMLRAYRHAERGPAQVADALGLPGWRAERLARQARTYREEELAAAMNLLARVDRDLKGELPPEGKLAALEGAVVRIVAGKG